MKPLNRVSYFLVLILILGIRAEAQSTATYGTLVTSLSTTSAGAVSGTAFSLPSSYSVMITWQVVADGSALSVILEGSLNNSIWFTVDTQTTATGGIKNFGFSSLKFVRISSVSRTGGTATTGTLITSRGFITQAGVTLNNPVFTGQSLFANGTATAPSIAPFADPLTGFFFNVGSANRIEFTTGGVSRGAITTAGWIIQPGAIFLGSGLDAVLRRVSAGIFSLDNGTANTSGVLDLGDVTFATLGTPSNGTISFCNDCGPTTPATCPATKASCICAGSGLGSLAVRANSLWYCTF